MIGLHAEDVALLEVEVPVDAHTVVLERLAGGGLGVSFKADPPVEEAPSSNEEPEAPAEEPAPPHELRSGMILVTPSGQLTWCIAVRRERGRIIHRPGPTEVSHDVSPEGFCVIARPEHLPAWLVHEIARWRTAEAYTNALETFVIKVMEARDSHTKAGPFVRDVDGALVHLQGTAEALSPTQIGDLFGASKDAGTTDATSEEGD